MSPGRLAGGLTGAVAGALMVALSAYGGEFLASLPAIFALALPLIAIGIVYGWLVESERITSGFGHGILFWSGAFVVARLTQVLLLGGGTSGPPEGLGAFVVYQLMVGGAFGLGFVMLHHQIESLTRRLLPRETAPNTEREAPKAG